ncbi:restriction endonuclease subunit S [Psychrobacter sp. Ps7]|uniref:restriction endonuclease subunit S n=1 Tax=Psychrobacter sp. Ps7 TaxID=2790961 RepID=UPI001EDD37C3|nr:restriction endonuclease subunit S [Psychrobacter sp. Ps7]MCG3873568.1 restriction endonuclease subunit S [Psychrobacter sp. Ps7]
MVSEEAIYTVGELIKAGVLYKPLDGNHGGIHPKGNDFVESGIPFVMASDMSNGQVDTKTCKFISADQASTLRKGFAITGDVLISHKATIGRTAIVGEIESEFIVLTPQVTYYRVKDTDQLNNRYLKYYFDSYEFQGLLNQWAGGGSTRAYLGITGQLKLPIKILDIQKQKAIAHILGSLDDKIELNRQMNETLEAMAQALFKSWFVDFDPVIDNALAAGKPIPDEFMERAEQRKAIEKKDNSEIQHLFPDTFEFTEEMGWIPQGWDVDAFSEHSIITMGQSPKGTSYNSDGEGIALINGPVEFGEYFTSKIKWTTEPTRICKEGDLIVCVRGSTTGRYVKSDGAYCIGRGVCSIRGKKSQCFSDFWFKNALSDLLRFATGSTFPSWNGPMIKSFSSIIPSSKVIAEFDKLVSPMVKQQGISSKEGQTLAKLRDTLLPKLMSGELRIPEAAALVDEAI